MSTEEKAIAAEPASPVDEVATPELDNEALIDSQLEELFDSDASTDKAPTPEEATVKAAPAPDKSEEVESEGLDEEIIGLASHALFSEPALAEFAPGQSISEALIRAAGLNRGWVGVTQGASGTHWLEEGILRHMPAFEVKSLDTLGAGDVFHGIFALGLSEGHSEQESLRSASAAAAIRCSRTGGRKAIPKQHEINAFLKEQS